MSLSSWPKECPECGSKEFHEIGRIEANEFGGPSAAYPQGDPPTDRAIYQCEPDRHEWEQ
jgi:hypothetical protein